MHVCVSNKMDISNMTQSDFTSNLPPGCFWHHG